MSIPKKARFTEFWPSRLCGSTSSVPLPNVEESETIETIQTTAISDICWQWGTVSNLSGLLSSFCIFSDSLNHSHFSTLFQQGKATEGV